MKATVSDAKAMPSSPNCAIAAGRALSIQAGQPREAPTIGTMAWNSAMPKARISA